MSLPLPVIERTLCRRSLYEFVKRAWHLVEPGERFRDNWHIKVICDELQKVSRGETLRLIINIPPGHMKSLLVSVFWPAWVWIQEQTDACPGPAFKWLVSSFDPDLTRRDAERMLRIIRSDWFRARWPDAFNLKKDLAVANFDNSRGGFRLSTSVKGKTTGRHVDCIVVDDPIKPAELGEASLELVKSWWHGTLASRLKTPAEGRKVIIMQRLHEDDLVGFVLGREKNWTHLRFPMLYEADGGCEADIRTEEGELLWPERFPKNVVDAWLEGGEMTAQVFASQYQQRPSPDGGLIFRKEWFQVWDALPTRFDQVIQSWDLSFKGADTSDFVVGQVWARKGGAFYLLDQIRARLDFPATIKAIHELSRKYPKAVTKLIEDKANGSAVISTLRKEGKLIGITEVNPEGGKESRANAVAPLFEARNVWHPDPRIHPWVEQHREEMLNFPNGRNDDTVDACSQALTYLLAKSTRFGQAMTKARAAGVNSKLFGR